MLLEKLLKRKRIKHTPSTTTAPMRALAKTSPLRQRAEFYKDGLVSVFRKKKVFVLLSRETVKITPRYISLGVRLQDPTQIKEAEDPNTLKAMAHGAGISHVMLEHKDGILWYQFPVPNASSPTWADADVQHNTIGISALGEPVCLTNEEWDRGHILVSGMTGSGKSCLLSTMMCSLVLQYNPKEVGFIIIDPACDHYKWDRSAYMLGPVASTREDIAAALAFAANEAQQRVKSRRHITERDTLKRWVVFVDEADGDEAFPDDCPELLDYGQLLALHGRKSLVHMVLGTHRPSASIYKPIFDVCATKLLGQAFDAQSSGRYGAGLHLDWLQGKGDFKWKRGDQTIRFQSIFTTDTQLQRLPLSKHPPKPFPPPQGITKDSLGGLHMGVPLEQDPRFLQVKEALAAINPKVLTFVLMNGSTNVQPEEVSVKLNVPLGVAKVNYRLAIAVEKEKDRLR